MKTIVKYVYHSITLLSIFLFCSFTTPATSIVGMRCEYNTNPINIGISMPRFSWNYSANNTFQQYKYKICITTDRHSFNESSHRNGFYWTSGIINSSLSFAQYNGKIKLTSFTKYYWQIIAWNKSGKRKVISPVNYFETAMINQKDWHGQWITDEYDKDYNPAPMLRKSFRTNKSIINKARLYVSAAAYCMMKLNGKQVSNSLLNPGYTHYDKRNLYSVSDVTALIKSGENVLSAVLGNGFYNEIAPVGTWDFEKARWRNRARMICELHIIYTDGTKQIIGSDASWKTNTGPYIQNNIYGGDTYDTRLEISGWDKPGFDDSSWKNAKQVKAPSPLLTSQYMPPIKIDREISPVNFISFGDSLFVYDFGVNMSGFCRLTIQGEKGTKITLRHGEIQKANGRLETGNIDIYFKSRPNMAFQTDTYILDGKNDILIPHFNYHGFQYVEIHTDHPVMLTKKDLKAEFFHTAVTPTGNFCCSNTLLNKIWKAVNQSYLSNLMSIPTDCPQREKNGWTADAHISMDTGLLNFDGITLYEKWINDMIDNQTPQGRISGIIPSSGWGYDDWIGPVWDAAMFIVPMNLYRYYGDIDGIRKIWPACQKYLAYLNSREDKNGTVTYGIGDWVFYKTQTPTDYTTTCYYYMDNLYMAQFARLLGKDSTNYALKAEKLKSLINHIYFDPKTSLYSNGSQAAQGIALYLGIVSKEYEQKVADKLSQMIKKDNNFLDFGMLGSKTVLRMLSKYGYADQAYELATKEESPSWGNWIKKGLTALPETWKLSPTFKDASLNHIFLGDINAWMYNVLAGINYDEQNPGFRHILIHPYFVKGLDWVKAEYHSVNGLIKSEWKRSGNKIVLNITIPTNTSATVEVESKKNELCAGTHQLIF